MRIARLRKGDRLGLIACFVCTGLSLCAGAAQQSVDSLSLATSLVREGKYDQAIAEVERSLRLHANDSRLLTIEGIAYSMKGDDSAALHALDSALHIDPKMMAALRAKAQITTRRHQADAIPVLEQILQFDARDATAREMLAGEQAHDGQCEKAITNFEGLGAVIDGHSESLLRYGACLFRDGKYEAAVTQFEKLVRASPESEDARYDLALAQGHMGNNKAALTTLAPLIAKGTDVDSLSLAAEAAEATGDTPQAVALLRQAIVLDPMIPDSYVRFAEICLEHESYQAGIEMMSAGLSRMPRDPALYMARGLLYGGEADYVKGETDFRAAEHFDPKHGTGAYGVGLVQAQSNHPEEAIKTAREGLKRYPEDGQLNLLLARLQIEVGQLPGSEGFEEARRAAETAVRLRPDLTAAHDVLSKVYMMQGEMPKAILECRAALNLDPEDMVAMYRLLLASRKVGDTTTVQELTRRVSQGHQKARDAETERLRYRIQGTTAEKAATPTQP